MAEPDDLPNFFMFLAGELGKLTRSMFRRPREREKCNKSWRSISQLIKTLKIAYGHNLLEEIRWLSFQEVCHYMRHSRSYAFLKSWKLASQISSDYAQYSWTKKYPFGYPSLGTRKHYQQIALKLHDCCRYLRKNKIALTQNERVFSPVKITPEMSSSFQSGAIELDRSKGKNDYWNAKSIWMQFKSRWELMTSLGRWSTNEWQNPCCFCERVKNARNCQSLFVGWHVAKSGIDDKHDLC